MTALVHHETILWFDLDREYAPVLDHPTELDLWSDYKSLLEIRYRLTQRGADERTVVYLPLCQDQGEILRPIFAISLIFRDGQSWPRSPSVPSG